LTITKGIVGRKWGRERETVTGVSRGGSNAVRVYSPDITDEAPETTEPLRRLPRLLPAAAGNSSVQHVQSPGPWHLFQSG